MKPAHFKKQPWAHRMETTDWGFHLEAENDGGIKQRTTRNHWELMQNYGKLWQIWDTATAFQQQNVKESDSH